MSYYKMRNAIGGNSSAVVPSSSPKVPGVPGISSATVSQIPTNTGGGLSLSGAGVIGGILNGVAGVGNMISGFINNKRNYDLQLEQQKYERDLQQQIFDREDNAIQRQVADLKAAGLSPVLASGSGAGSGAVVPISTPQQKQTQLPSIGNDVYDLLSATQRQQQLDLNELAVANSSLQNKLLLEKLNQAREITKKLGLQNDILGQDVDWYVPTKVFRAVGRLGSVVRFFK